MSFIIFLMAASAVLEGHQEVKVWTFCDSTACEAWQANAHFSDVSCDKGMLNFRAIDWDPFSICTGLSIPATASQYVRLRLRASSGGNGELFWTGQLSGTNGGFDAAKSTPFQVAGGNFEDVFILPCWHREGVIRQLRLDLYEDAAFEIESISVLDFNDAVHDQQRVSWEFSTDLESTGWQYLNTGNVLASPLLSIPAERYGWVSLLARSETDTTLALYWSTDGMLGKRHETLYIQGDKTPRYYHIELRGNPQWSGNLVNLHLAIPETPLVTIEKLSVCEEPDGPPDLEVTYFGFENGVSRAGRPEALFAQITNRGGGNLPVELPQIHLPHQLHLVEGPKYQHTYPLWHGDLAEIRWIVKAETDGIYPITLSIGEGAKPIDAEFSFLPPFNVNSEYVPEPRPIPTTRKILAYYFPGWESDAKWDCIRNTAPIRRPLLGYYDESNPACVDWQIKWAVENGISCFLVDWYWSSGNQALLHWFDAYREARYRDLLKVALMWANHNAPGTHSREDWRAVTREWIERYFSLPSYYHVSGMPAIYIWDARSIRNDLGGSEEAAAALAESQEMARSAGFPGIAFIALQHSINETDAGLLLKEGYYGHTSYHEWGKALEMAPAPSRGHFEDMVSSVPESWQNKRNVQSQLKYYPVVDTGWDSRPWHGMNATAFHGRSVSGFKALLLKAREYCDQYDDDTVILGPLNEWGEGSYIEPNLEFGFSMYEAIREVFGEGAPADWPGNFAPRDVGLGPYEFPASPRSFSWAFDNDAEGWAPFMNLSDFRAEDGSLYFTTYSPDPAIVKAVNGLQTNRHGTLMVKMQVSGDLPPESHMQLFWTFGAGGTSESCSMRLPLFPDEQMHEYRFDLSTHPRWRGRISSLRFDPCDFSGAQFTVDMISFQ